MPVVQSVGCAEVEGTMWFLTRTTDPTESDTPYSSDSEIEEAHTVSLGSNRFQSIGVAEFLDVEGLLDQFQRADFTARESVNSIGQLKAQHKLLHQRALHPGYRSVPDQRHVGDQPRGFLQLIGTESREP